MPTMRLGLEWVRLVERRAHGRHCHCFGDRRIKWGDLHLMVISTYHKGETAIDSRMVRAVVRVLKRTRRDKSVVVRVEGDRAEFFPVPDERLLREDLVQGYFCLRSILMRQYQPVERAMLGMDEHL